MNSLPVQLCVYFGGAPFGFADFLEEIASELLITVLYPSNVDSAIVNSFKNTSINYLLLQVSVTELPPLAYQTMEWSAENRLQTPNQSFPNIQIDFPPLLPSMRYLSTVSIH